MREWTGSYRTKPELIEAINKKLQAFPGIIFNYTQPAEDAVDEAETGLEKRPGGEGVRVRPRICCSRRAKPSSRCWTGVRGITDVTLVQELGQPSLTIEINRAKIARYGLNVADINGLIEAAIGGDVATQVVQGEKQFDLVVRLEQQYRDNPEEIGNIPVATPRRPADSAEGVGRHPGDERRLVHLSRKQFALYRRAVLGGGTRPGRRGATTPSSRSDRRSSLPQGYRAGLGRRIHGIHRLAPSTERHPAADPVPDLPAAVCALQQFQVSLHHRAGRVAVGAGGRHRGALADRHAVLGFVGHRISGPVRRLGADGRRLYFLRQRAAPRRHAASRRPSARARSCGCARS